MANYVFNPFTGALTPTPPASGLVPGIIVNADISASAAIAGTKVAPDFGSQTVITTGSALIGTATSLSTLYSGAGKLQAASNDATTIQGYAFSSTGVDYSATLELSRARNTQASPAIVVNGDYIGQINFAGYNTNFQRGATIYALVDGEPGTAGDTTDMPGKLVFATTPNGSTTPTTRMSIDSAGAVTLSGTLDVPLGAAATPSITFTGDLNTGIYSPDADQVAVATNGTARLYIASDGKVGIGVTNPSSALEVYATAPVLTVNSAAANASSILFQQNGTTYARFRFDGNNVDIGNLYSNGATIFNAGNAERARIDSSGRLLVGTSTATNNLRLDEKFAVVGTSASYPGMALTGYTGTAGDYCPIFEIQRSRGTSDGSFTKVENGDCLGKIMFRGADGSSWANGAYIEAYADAATGAGDLPTRLVFSTTADGGSSPTERMRITSAGVLQIADAGNITVGTTTGTKIGTATTQKLGFYNATPVVQPTAVADATTAVDVITQLNALLAKLRTLGIIAT